MSFSFIIDEHGTYQILGLQPANVVYRDGMFVNKAILYQDRDDLEAIFVPPCMVREAPSCFLQ